MREYWRVYPVKAVKGFTQTFIPQDGTVANCLRAHNEAAKMELASGVVWKVEKVTK